jgi:CMP-N-acetylneuraminic acid synthetase
MRETRRVAVVLARGGSKRIPKKNLVRIQAKSLSQIAVECGLDSGLETVISSDSQEILNQEFSGAVNKILRPPKLSDDFASSESGILHVIQHLGLSDSDEIVLLPPTSPLRTHNVLNDFLAVWDMEFRQSGFEQALSVTPMKNDFWIGPQTQPKRVRDLLAGSSQSRRSQEREPIMLENSAIYLSQVRALKESHSLYGGKLALINIPFLSSLDIDDENDLILARLLFENRSEFA